MFDSHRPGDGIQFLERTEENWANHAAFGRHVWWHKSLHYFQLGDYDSVVKLYDDTIKPGSEKSEWEIGFCKVAFLLYRLKLGFIFLKWV